MSVGPSVGRSVGRSVRRSDGPVLFSNDENRGFEVGKTLKDQQQQ